MNGKQYENTIQDLNKAIAELKNECAKLQHENNTLKKELGGLIDKLNTDNALIVFNGSSIDLQDRFNKLKI